MFSLLTKSFVLDELFNKLKKLENEEKATANEAGRINLRSWEKTNKFLNNKIDNG